MRTMHGVAQPEMHETIAIIEQYNQPVIDGTRTLLVQAGLPPVFCALVFTCYCVLCNNTELALGQEKFPGPTKWHTHIGHSSKGNANAFGSAVY